MKLSLEALKERAETIASEELLSEIAGGIENDCHCDNKNDGDVLIEDLLR